MDDFQPVTRFQAQPRTAPSRFSRLPLLLLLFLGIIVLAYIPVLVQRLSYSKTMGELQALREVLPKMDLKALSKAYTLVYRKIEPSVVHISTVRTVRANNQLAMLFGQPGTQLLQQRAEGSGVIVDKDGYIVTNQHVVEGFSEISVTLADGRTLRAEVKGSDPAIDLAVLKVDATGLIAAEWGDSDKLEPGELVWAIGNPFGLDQTVTSGIVSGKGRHLNQQKSPFQEFLQTDVAINPGNSGGPLVDINGDVVGINAAIVGNTYEGVSFAIPSNLVRSSYLEIINKGRVVRGYVGVGLVTLDAAVAADLAKIGFPTNRTKGVVVAQLNRNGPAANAGIQLGDVITEFNGQQVADSGAMTVLIGQSPVGTKVPVKLDRRGQEQAVEVTIEERPDVQIPRGGQGG